MVLIYDDYRTSEKGGLTTSERWTKYTGEHFMRMSVVERALAFANVENIPLTGTTKKTSLVEVFLMVLIYDDYRTSEKGGLTTSERWTKYTGEHFMRMSVVERALAFANVENIPLTGTTKFPSLNCTPKSGEKKNPRRLY